MAVLLSADAIWVSGPFVMVMPFLPRNVLDFGDYPCSPVGRFGDFAHGPGG